MSVHINLVNKPYLISKRDFTDDYSNTISLKHDMTMSGKYLGEYPKFNIKVNDFDKYPTNYIVNKLSNRIKEKYNFKGNVIIGTGTNGLLQNLIKIIFKNKGNLVTPFYTFNQVEYSVTSYGSVTRRVLMDDENINFKNLLDSIDEKTKMVYICNPNNPTGCYIKTKRLIEELKSISSSILVVIDESSIEFSYEKSMLDYKLPDNFIVLRTFSKAFGLADLRVGFMTCNEEIYNLYKKNITVNDVSGITCSIALQVLDSNLYLDNVKLIISERDKMVKELNKLGVETYNTLSNIILTKSTFSEDELNELINNEISIVEVVDFYKNKHIRIAVQDSSTNEIFINVMKKIKGGV